jgi:uncharacterized damage-inducible protein DinB
MTDIDRIIDELQRGFDGDPWHGDSLVKILGGVDAKTAARRPLANAHSIWELVLHVTGWTREVASRMRGTPAGEPPAGDWPRAPSGAAATDAAWRAAIDDLTSACRELLDAVRALDSQTLERPVNDPRHGELGTGMTYAQTLHGVAQHFAYHAGQISLLKKAPGV